jgi:hypothetical protein
MEAGGVEGLGQRHLGEDRRQAPGQPRLPRPGRPQEQKVVVRMPAFPSALPSPRTLPTASAMPYSRKGSNGEGQAHPPVISAAVLWAIIRVVALILPLTIMSMMGASTTRSPSTLCARNDGSTRASGSCPILQGAYRVIAVSAALRIPSISAASLCAAAPGGISGSRNGAKVCNWAAASSYEHGQCYS